MAQLAVLAAPLAAYGAASAAGLGNFGAAAAGYAAAFLANRLFGGAGQTQEIGKLRDRKTQTSEYGTPIPEVFGSMRIAGSVIWAKPLHEVRQTDTKNGAKIRTYYYFGRFAVAFCAGPVAAVRRIWADDKLIVDFSNNPFKGKPYRYTKGPKGTKVKPKIKIYLGTETQKPDPYIESFEGAGDVPAFRGLCYVVFEDLPLKHFGNRLPTITAEIVSSGQVSRTAVDHLPKWSGMAQTPLNNTSHMNWDIDENGRVAYMLNDGHLIAWDLHTHTRIYSNYLPDDPQVKAAGSYYNETFDETSFDVYGYLVYNEYRKTVFCTINEATTRMYVFEMDAETGKCLNVWRTGLGSTGVAGRGRYLVVGVHAYLSENPYVVDLGSVGRGPSIGNVPVKVATLNFSYEFTVTEWGRYETKDYFFFYRYSFNPQNAYFVRIRKSDWTVTSVQANSFFGQNKHSRNSIMLLDETTDYLIFIDTSNHWVHQIDMHNVTLVNSANPASPGFGFYSRIYNTDTKTVKDGYIWLNSSNQNLAIKLNTVTLTVDETLNFASLGVPVNTSSLVLFHQENDQIYFMSTIYQTIGLNAYASTEQTIGSLIGSICQKVGFVAADYDVSGLTDLYHGYLVAQPSSARAIIETLMDAFLFDIVESGFKLKFVKRDSSSVRTISWDELGAREDDAGEPDDVIKETRIQELELPRRISVTIADPNRNYDPITFVAQRLQNLVLPVDEENIELPMALSYSVARRIPLALLGSFWGERTQVEFTLSHRHVDLDPGDIITVTKTGPSNATLVIRITEITLGEGWVIAVKGVYHRNTVFNLTDLVDPDVPPANDGDSSTIEGNLPSKLLLLNLPCRSSSDEGHGGFWIGAGPRFYDSDGSWQGCEVFRSQDGIAYAAFTTILEPTSHAIALTRLPAVKNWASWDTTSQLDIQVMTAGWTPTSSTDLDVLNGANRILVGDEIIAFVNVQNLGGNRYRLSRLLRGMHSTDFAVTEHTDLETVVDLSDTDLLKVGSLDDRLLPLKYQYSTFDYPNDEDETITFTNEAACLKPYSPAKVSASRTGTGTGATASVSWARRTRYGGGLVDGTGTVPLNENYEQYEIDIRDPENKLLRTVVQNTTSLSYQLSNYLSDSNKQSLTFTYQHKDWTFERLDISNWTVISGSWQVGRHGLVPAHEGQYYLFSGSSSSQIRFDLDITEILHHDEVDLGTGTVTLRARQSRINASNSAGFITLAALDGAHNSITSASSSNTSYSDWTLVQVSFTLPTGTRHLRITLNGGSGGTTFDSLDLEIDGLVPIITFEVYQMSAQVGRGYVRRIKA